MALELRFVEMTKMLKTERARVSRLEQRTNQLESQLVSFKSVILDVMRQSIRQLEDGLAIDGTGASSILTPPMTANTLARSKSGPPPHKDHLDKSRKIKPEGPDNLSGNVDISQNSAKPHSVNGARNNKKGHMASNEADLGSELSVSPELGATKALGGNKPPSSGCEPGELADNISLFPVNSNDKPSRRSSAPHMDRFAPVEGTSARPWDRNNIRERYYTYSRDLSQSQSQSRSRSRQRYRSVGESGGTGQSKRRRKSKSRSRSRSRKRRDDYNARESSGHAYTDYKRSHRSRSPAYDSRRDFGGNVVQKNYSPDHRRQRGADRTTDALHNVERDMKARIQHVDKRRDLYYEDTAGDPKALHGWNTRDDNDSDGDDKATAGWAVYSYKNKKGNDRKNEDADTGFAMPRSISQIMTKDSVSSRDKVLSWQKDALVGDPESINVENANIIMRTTSESTTDDMNDIADDHRLDSRSSSSTDNRPRVKESITFAGTGADDGEDDEDDDDDLFECLKSRSFQAERAMSMLVDSAGTPLTTGHLAPIWKASAWVPFDDLPILYKRYYEKELFTPETRKKIRLHLPKLPNISERPSYNNNRECTLLFMKGSHLENPKAYRRVFVRQMIAEPALFFFLTTSVYWPLEDKQADIIFKMWEDQFRHSPVGLTTVKRSDGSEEKKWLDMNTLWHSAINWLKELVHAVKRQGCKYLLNKLSNWGDTENVPVSTSKHKLADTVPRDPEADLVYGLGRDELLGVLRMAPVLLKNKLPKADILSLEDELAQPM